MRGADVLLRKGAMHVMKVWKTNNGKRISRSPLVIAGLW